MKNILKLGSIALALPLMMAPLCHAQTQWSSEQPLGGDPASDPYAIQVPGTNILQVFYQGTDNGLWTRWRNPAVGSTPAFWSDEAPLGGQLSSSGSNPVAIQLPGTNIIQVFYRGANNALWSVWRNPADGNTPPSWSPPQNLGGILAGDPAVAQIPGTNTVQVFYQGADHAMYTRGLTNGTWSKEQGLGDLFLRRPAVIQLTVIQLTLHVMELPQSPFRFRYPTRMISRSLPGLGQPLAGFRERKLDTAGLRRIPRQRSLSGTGTRREPNTSLLPAWRRMLEGAPFSNNPCQAIGGGSMTQWGNPENLSSWTHETQMAGHLEGYML